MLQLGVQLLAEAHHIGFYGGRLAVVPFRRIMEMGWTLNRVSNRRLISRVWDTGGRSPTDQHVS
jgi:hypothetical protein